MSEDEQLESVIDAAKRHGEDSEPDHEVGDLQDCLRAACEQMFPDQFERFMRSPAVLATLEAGGEG